LFGTFHKLAILLDNLKPCTISLFSLGMSAIGNMANYHSGAPTNRYACPNITLMVTRFGRIVSLAHGVKIDTILSIP